MATCATAEPMDLEQEELLSGGAASTKPRTSPRRALAGAATALALLALAFWHSRPPREAGTSGLGGGLLREFQLLDAWQMVSGGDPFHCICPMTVFQRMAAVALVGKAAEGDCCTTYNAVPMLWPYQFPECGKNHCPSCWRADGDLASSDVAGYAALGFAASLAVSSPKVLLPEAQDRRLADITRHAGIDSKQMLGRAKHGLRERVVNLCPRVSDWEEYYLNDDAENVHARVYKSASAQVAVVSFRGTQAKSAQNWEIDSDINMLNVKLGAPGPHGPAPSEVNIHEGFYLELQRVLPHVRKWVEGYIEGTQGLFGIPSYWKLVFTGHSLGAALAILAATMAEAESWPRLPDAVIAYASPRVGDAGLSQWWQSRDLCKKLLRVSVYNDVITYMPFMEPLQLVDSLNYCFQNVVHCLGELASGPKALHPSTRWAHVCPSSELRVPGAVKGVNAEMQDFSLLGGALAHFIGNALFGYSYGVLNSEIPHHDAYCGLRKELLPAESCASMEDLDEVVCFGLAHDVNATSAASCRKSCCDDEYCSVWQLMRNNQCWRGRSHHCTALHPNAAQVAAGQRLH